MVFHNHGCANCLGLNAEYHTCVLFLCRMSRPRSLPPISAFPSCIPSAPRRSPGFAPMHAPFFSSPRPGHRPSCTTDVAPLCLFLALPPSLLHPVALPVPAPRLLHFRAAPRLLRSFVSPAGVFESPPSSRGERGFALRRSVPAPPHSLARPFRAARALFYPATSVGWLDSPLRAPLALPLRPPPGRACTDGTTPFPSDSSAPHPPIFLYPCARCPRDLPRFPPPGAASLSAVPPFFAAGLAGIAPVRMPRSFLTALFFRTPRLVFHHHTPDCRPRLAFFPVPTGFSPLSTGFSTVRTAFSTEYFFFPQVFHNVFHTQENALPQNNIRFSKSAETALFQSNEKIFSAREKTCIFARHRV